MTTSTKGRQFHSKAESVREANQDFLESLKLTDEAMVAYVEDKDYLGLAEVQGTRALALRHLFDKTNDDAYLKLAEHTMKAAIEIAEASGDKQAIPRPYFDLGKIYLDMKEYSKAAKTLQKAFDTVDDLPEFHNRPGQKSDAKAKLGFAKAMSGDESGQAILQEAIDELENNSEELKYNRDVWLSGAHMLMAQVDKENLGEHMNKAKEIIDSNEELVLRRGQWEKLSVELSS